MEQNPWEQGLLGLGQLPGQLLTDFKVNGEEISAKRVAPIDRVLGDFMPMDGDLVNTLPSFVVIILYREIFKCIHQFSKYSY